MSRVDAREWRWVLICAGLLLVLVAVPYAVALLFPPKGFLLERTLYYGNDLSQYLAAMGDGRASTSWLVQDHLTSEPHNPALMYPFYVLLGKLAGGLGIPPLVLLAFSLVLAVIVLVLAGYLFVSTFADSVAERRLGLLFLLFAPGLGLWMAVTTGLEDPISSPEAYLAFDRAELSAFLLPFGPPHLILALSLLLLWGRSLASWSWKGETGVLLVLLASVVGVGLLNPFTLVPMVGLATGYALLRWVWGARFPGRAAAAALLVALVAAPFLVSSLLTFALDPFWSVVYGKQNTTRSPGFIELLAQLGVLLPLGAVAGIWGRGRRQTTVFLVFWAVALLGMMYLPVPFQRRFGFGLQPALAVLASLGSCRVVELLGATGKRGFVVAFLSLVSLLTFGATVLAYSGLVMVGAGLGGLAQTVFEPRSNVEASDWLAEHSGPSDVVLASLDTGNFLAGRIRGRVVLGHYAGTLDPVRKELRIRGFFSPTATAEDRWRLVAEERVTFVFLGRRERALGGPSLRAEEGFRLVFQSAEVEIYRVERSLSRASPRERDLARTVSTSPRNNSCHSPLAARRVAVPLSFSTSAIST